MNNHRNLRHEERNPTFISRFFDLVVLGLALYVSLVLYGQVVTNGYIMLYFCVSASYMYIAESTQLYRSWRVGKFSQNLWLVVFCLVSAFFLMLTFTFTLKTTENFSRVILTGWFSLSFLGLGIWRLAGRMIKNAMHQQGISTRTVAIVGANQNGVKLVREMLANPDIGYVFHGFYDDRTPDRLDSEATLIGNIDACIEDARSGAIDKLYITLPMAADKRIAEIIQRLGDTTVDVHLVPDFLLYNLMHARLGNVGNMDTISVFESPYFGARDWIKRTFDIGFSSLALLGLALPMTVIAIMIKVTSKGPVFFKQDRYGLDGKPIKVYKFRSMTVQDNGSEVKQATKGDARITPLGAFLRRTSLDELPQFINVFLGDMSVVGPRPHAVAHNEQYRKLVAFYMLRHKVKPGITGWAQINGWRGETDTLDKMEKRVEHDLDYIKNWSLWWDAKIIFLTFFRGFVGKNVY